MFKMHKNKIILSTILCIVLVISLGFSDVAAIPNNNPAGFVDVLIAFDSTPGHEESEIVMEKGGVIKYSYTLVPAIAASIPQTAISELLRNPSIVRIEPDIKMYAVGGSEEVTYVPWGIERVGAIEAHDNNYTGSGVGVAIFDTGIDTDHGDLDVAGGVNFYTVTTGPPWERGTFAGDNYNDFNGHGTHVAGTVAALGNNIAGVAPNVSLYAVKVLGDDGSGNYSDAIAGLDWVVDYNDDNPENRIHITNHSYGSSGNPGETVKDAFKEAYGAGVLHVGAAGNRYGDGVIYPAKYESVIAVSATTEGDELADFSSVGSEVELAAPGKSVLSTWNNDTSRTDPQPFEINGDYYKYASGTSMASPHVAGVAALLWADDLELSNEKIREKLRSNAEDIGLDIEEQGHGLVNAAIALGLIEPPEPVEYAVEISPISQNNTGEPGGKVDYTFTITNTGTQEDSYDFSISGNDWTASISQEKATIDAGKSLDVIITHAIPDDAKDGDSDTRTLTVTSVNASDKAEFTTTAELEAEDEPDDPVIEKFELNDTSNPAWARVTVEWTVSAINVNLATVESKMLLGEEVIDSKHSSVSGYEASGTHELRNQRGHGKTYEIILTVTDIDGNKTSETKSISLE